MFRFRICVGLFGLALLGGCEEEESRTNPSGDTPAGQMEEKSRSGYARGSLLHENGQPITAPGAKLSVGLHGISSKSGEKVQYSPKVNADGSYEQKLVDGAYSFYGAHVALVFEGKNYRFDLEPVGDDRSDRESTAGIVQNYVWKITGPRPGKDQDPANFTHWYGGAVNMQFNFYREDLKKAVKAGPPGTRCVFTLKPKGRIIDGSEGKVLTFERDYEQLSKNSNLHDIPIGVYVVSGIEVAPDGSKKPLRIQQGFAVYGESTEVTFATGSSTGVWPAPVGFTRDE